MLDEAKTLKILDELNPYKTFRPGQREAIFGMLSALDEGENVIELSAPTSAGKSVMLVVFARAAIKLGLVKRIVLTTPQKVLIDQYRKESSGKMAFDGIVLGRGNYPCSLDPTMRADACVCKSPKARKSHPECSKCAYEKAKGEFKRAKLALTTMAYYMAGYAPEEGDEEGLIIDESSNVEANLLERFALKIPTSAQVPGLAPYYKDGIDKAGNPALIPTIDFMNPDELRKMLSDYVLILQPELEELNAELEAIATFRDDASRAKKKQLSKEINFRERELFKCQKILHYIADGEKYYVNEDRQFKLIFGKALFKNLMRPISFATMASGTPNTRLLTDEYKKIEMEHPIPVENRECVIRGVGPMNLKARAKTIPQMAKEIAYLQERWGAGRHTIVHCHSFQIAEDINRYLRKETKAKIILQDRFDRLGSLEKWQNTKGDAIFLSVAFVEGLNLKGEEYPLNIIIKVPFAYLGDGWIKVRQALDGGAYSTMEAVIAIEQAAGRTTRAPNDFSKTFILDSDMKWFIKKNENYFEPWFLDAVTREDATA